MKLVSGGQTGADRAALDAALARDLPCGGWCPRGRRAEDGAIPTRYPLRETPEAGYEQRTRWNVRDSEATLILAAGALRGGTALTRKLARQAGRPLLVVDPGDDDALARVRAWLDREGVAVLNVAGPRESQQPGIYAAARRLLELLIAELPAGREAP